MSKSKELSSDVIDVELEKGYTSISHMTEKPKKDYSDVSRMTGNLHTQTENLVRDQKLPEKTVISEISTTDMVIDLALANIAKQTSIKLSRMETFLSALEDKLFDESMLETMSKTEMMSLYANTRMMRTDAFRMLKEIRKDVDFAGLEAQLLSLHSKESMRETTDGQGDKMKSMLENILMNPDFLSQAVASQKTKLNKEEE